MTHLGFDAFAVAGHDRGGRCAYRLALDHPRRVTRVAVLDVLPTIEHYLRADQAFAEKYWHWFFLSAPYPVPERLIGDDAEYFFFQREWPDPDERPRYVAPEVLRAYLDAIHDPLTVHAICEDYRAAATLDHRADEADRGACRIACPVLALWATRSYLATLYDTLAVWRQWGDDVSGHGIDSGHYLAEERPDETCSALLEVFLEDRAS